MGNRAARAAAPAVDQRTAEQEREKGPSLIFEIAKVLATQQNLETTLSQLLSCLIETLDTADTGVLMLYDPSDERLTVRAAQGYNLDSLRLLRLAPGEATCGRTFQTGEIQRYPTPKAIARKITFTIPKVARIFTCPSMGGLRSTAQNTQPVDPMTAIITTTTGTANQGCSNIQTKF